MSHRQDVPIIPKRHKVGVLNYSPKMHISFYVQPVNIIFHKLFAKSKKDTGCSLIMNTL
jgi:hypothetical protein